MMRNAEALDRIRRSDKPYLVPREIADVFGCNPYVINLKARNGTLEFPFFTSGNRVKIPREAFLKWLDGKS